MTLDLKDIVPKKADFKLRSTGLKHQIRPITLADEIWLEQTFVDEEGNMPNLADNMEHLARAVYHQLVDKTPFKSQVVTLIDEDGKETTTEMGGYKLLLSLISGIEDKVSMLDAWLATIGISRPVQEAIKKKL